MKTLYIIRHGKSKWGEIGVEDFDRGLNDRGKNDIKLMGKKLKEKNIFPDIVISSPAKRAKKTVKKICEKIGFDLDKIIYEKGIFDNHLKGVDFYLELLMGIKNKHKSAFFVGHNYAWNELANYLIGKDIGNIPTSGVVSITFDIDSWDQISYSNGNLDFFIYPKLYS